MNESDNQTESGGIFLILSNLAILPAVLYTLKKGLYIDSSILIIVFIISSTYHTCQSGFFCIVQFDSLQKVDHFFVYQAFIWISLYIVNVPINHRIVLLLFFHMLLLPFTLQYIGSWWLAGITFGGIALTCIITLSFFYWEQPILSKFDFMFAMTLLGSGFYLHVIGGAPGQSNYWLWHALWHMFAMFAVLFVYTFKTSGGILHIFDSKKKIKSTKQQTFTHNEFKGKSEVESIYSQATKRHQISKSSSPKNESIFIDKTTNEWRININESKYNSTNENRSLKVNGSRLGSLFNNNNNNK